MLSKFGTCPLPQLISKLLALDILVTFVLNANRKVKLSSLDSAFALGRSGAPQACLRTFVRRD